MDVNELKLNDDELIEYEAKISKRALIMIWAAIPALFLFIFFNGVSARYYYLFGKHCTQKRAFGGTRS